MLTKLICQDQALLRDLTRDFNQKDINTNNSSIDEEFNELEMIQRYYALKEQVSGSVELGKHSNQEL